MTEEAGGCRYGTIPIDDEHINRSHDDCCQQGKPEFFVFGQYSTSLY
jgi:hypothetical protein